jgi:hypothetical protein
VLQQVKHDGFMPNQAIEFHDSTFDGIRRDGTDLILRFSAAYIHQSTGKPGVEAGSGWVQEVLLHVSGGFVEGEIPELPCDLWDGDLRLGGQSFDMIPIPLHYEGEVEISLERHRRMRITGTGIRVELIGAASHVEEFPGHR